MEEPAMVDDAWQLAQKTSKELQAALKGDKFSFDTVLPALLRYRTLSDTCAFLDIRLARADKVEAKLWDVHVTINQKFRNALHSFKSREGKRRLVEQRKAIKQYIKFIKSSQRYYREYIAKLAVAFEVPELEALAGVLNTAGATALLPASSASLSEMNRELVLRSYHETLLRLGDLSRYRETETTTKDRNWGSAVGYYNLAGALKPSSGASHNQLAAMALADKHEFRAVYHLYRAITVQTPYATAKANLEREFKSVRKAFEKGALNTETPKDGVASLLEQFTRLHAHHYGNLQSPAIGDLEKQMLFCLGTELRQRTLEAFLPKMILTNIAAEYIARADRQTRQQQYCFLQRLNLRTFSTVLCVLKLELESLGLDRTSQETDKLTVVTRHILPSLRLCASWVASHPDLTKDEDDTMLETRVEMWQTYTNVLTLLAATFRVDELPLVEYMLQEDEDTIGFLPLETERAAQRYCFLGTDNRKPSIHSKLVQRHHPNYEMLSRVRDVLTDVVKLVMDQHHPLRLCNGVFLFGDAGLEEELVGSSSIANTASSPGVDGEDTMENEIAESDAGEIAMKNMVDDIVGPEHENPWTPAQRIPPTETSALKPTPTTVSNDTTDYGVISTLTAQEMVHQMRASKSPKSPTFQGKLNQPVSPRPHLPSISLSPFTPIPGEFDNISPIVPRYPGISMATTKQVYSNSVSNEITISGTSFSPAKYASSPVQPRSAYREDLKKARTSTSMGAELQSWSMGENWPLNGQG